MTIDKDYRTDRDYERFAAVCAVLTAAAGLSYAVAFIVLGNLPLSAVLLMVGGVLTTAALVGGVRPAAGRGRGREQARPDARRRRRPWLGDPRRPPGAG